MLPDLTIIFICAIVKNDRKPTRMDRPMLGTKLLSTKLKQERKKSKPKIINCQKKFCETGSTSPPRRKRRLTKVLHHSMLS